MLFLVFAAPCYALPKLPFLLKLDRLYKYNLHEIIMIISAICISGTQLQQNLLPVSSLSFILGPTTYHSTTPYFCIEQSLFRYKKMDLC